MKTDQLKKETLTLVSMQKSAFYILKASEIVNYKTNSIYNQELLKYFFK